MADESVVWKTEGEIAKRYQSFTLVVVREKKIGGYSIFISLFLYSFAGHFGNPDLKRAQDLFQNSTFRVFVAVNKILV